MPNKLYLVGAGPGGRELLPEKTLSILRSADRVLGTPRVAQLYDPCVECDLPGLTAELQKPFSGTTAVLVGGDCCFFSLAGRLDREYSGLYEIERVNNLGSVPYFAAKIGISYDDACLLSLHGRKEHLVSRVAYRRKIFALTGGKSDVRNICNELFEVGLRGVEIAVGEKLSYPDERIVHGTPSDLKDEDFDELSVLYVENKNAVNPFPPLEDADFIRSDDPCATVPMTKEEIRSIVLSKLAVLPKDTVYDIGAGTGSVAVEAARKAFEGIVYAVEQREDACRLIDRNRIRHGAYNIKILCEKAPDCLVGLPPPDKAFVGGSSGTIASVVEMLVTVNPKIRIVADAVSLQSLNGILEAFRNAGFSDTETICVNVAKSRRIGRYDVMKAENPVYVVTGNRGGRCG